jgi:hypothetical protein
MALHGFGGVLEDIETRVYTRTCRYIEEREGTAG